MVRAIWFITALVALSVAQSAQARDPVQIIVQLDQGTTAELSLTNGRTKYMFLPIDRLKNLTNPCVLDYTSWEALRYGGDNDSSTQGTCVRWPSNGLYFSDRFALNVVYREGGQIREYLVPLRLYAGATPPPMVIRISFPKADYCKASGLANQGIGRNADEALRRMIWAQHLRKSVRDRCEEESLELIARYDFKNAIRLPRFDHRYMIPQETIDSFIQYHPEHTALAKKAQNSDSGMSSQIRRWVESR